jgi:serine/threonine-protein kinase
MGEPATPASDRYALAVVAFELLTGSKPFNAENFAAQARSHVEDDPPRASERDIDVPPAVDRVLERGMAKEPEDRWETACAMVRALDDALAAPPPRRRAAGGDATRVMAPLPPRRARGDDPAPNGRPGTAGGDHHAGAPSRGRRFGAGAVIALAALLLVVAGAVALFSSGGDDPETTAEREPAATRTAEPTQEATRTAEPTPEQTSTPEPTPEPTQTPAPETTPEQDQSVRTGGGGPGQDPTALQLKAFEFNNAGKPDQALKFAERAVRACEGSTAVSPCAYALFEYAKALRLTGNPQAAIAALEERKQRFPDNQPGAVEQELALARQAAGQSD